VRYSNVQYNTLKYCKVQCSTVIYSTISHTVPYCSVLSPQVIIPFVYKPYLERRCSPSAPSYVLPRTPANSCHEAAISCHEAAISCHEAATSCHITTISYFHSITLAENFSPCLKNVPTDLSFDVFCKKMKNKPLFNIHCVNISCIFLPLLPYCEICQFVQCSL